MADKVITTVRNGYTREDLVSCGGGGSTRVYGTVGGRLPLSKCGS